MNKNLETKACEPPDFSDWRTNRLKFLLTLYRHDLESIKTREQVKYREERALLRRWIKRMETELEQRKR